LKGKVLRSTGKTYDVLLENGTIKECKLKGNFRIKGFKATNPVAVGDNVLVNIADDNISSFIYELLPRENYIIRRSVNLSKRSHIIAANIDQTLILASLREPHTSEGFIDRLLFTAALYNIPSAIVFNKYDIYNNKDKEQLSRLIDLYTGLKYFSYYISIKNNINIEHIKKLLKDKITLIVGHSGVGKSSLINSIAPELNLKITKVSDYNFKGTHTTSFSQMFPLPFGGYIIDSPGIKEFGILDIKPEEISHFFPEMHRNLWECRFSTCTHTHEPNCAIIKNIKEGIISKSRYNSYLSIFNEIKNSKPDYQ
jgi:ribosome biogenesis GTPase